MAKYLSRLKARELRKKGVSVKDIAEKLKVSKSTASIWSRDIILTIEQLEKLRRASLKGAEKGRLKSALLQKKKWQDNMDFHFESGKKILGKLSNRELLIAGLALYWGEGSKKSRTIELCNSDPAAIQFFIAWLKKFFLIKNEDLRGYIGINAIHKSREAIVKEFWSKITGIPLAQFTKISYKKTKNKKVYENYDSHYGTIAIRVLQPSRFYGKIIGLINGLSDVKFMPT
jgi:transcriptional regulator with XRE-family HTH domain